MGYAANLMMGDGILLEKLSQLGGKFLATSILALGYYLALAIEQIHRRYSLDTVLVGYDRREEVRPLQLLFVDRLLPSIGVLVDGDAYHLQALVLVERILLLHVRDLTTARSAP